MARGLLSSLAFSSAPASDAVLAARCRPCRRVVLATTHARAHASTTAICCRLPAATAIRHRRRHPPIIITTVTIHPIAARTTSHNTALPRLHLRRSLRDRICVPLLPSSTHRPQAPRREDGATATSVLPLCLRAFDASPVGTASQHRSSSGLHQLAWHPPGRRRHEAGPEAADARPLFVRHVSLSHTEARRRFCPRGGAVHDEASGTPKRLISPATSGVQRATGGIPTKQSTPPLSHCPPLASLDRAVRQRSGYSYSSLSRKSRLGPGHQLRQAHLIRHRFLGPF